MAFSAYYAEKIYCQVKKSKIYCAKTCINRVNILLIESLFTGLSGGVSKSMLTLNEAIIDVKEG